MTFHDDLPTAGEASGQHAQVAPRRSRDPLAGPESDALLRRAADLVASARQLPMSSSVVVNRDEVLELLGEAIDKLPDELRQARLAAQGAPGLPGPGPGRGRRDPRRRQRQGRVHGAAHRGGQGGRAAGQRIVEAAQDEARRLRHESEDYCDQRLAQFEIVLERTMKMVHAGREKLNAAQITGPARGRRGRGTPAPDPPVTVPPGGFGAPETVPEDGFFDQDQG